MSGCHPRLSRPVIQSIFQCQVDDDVEALLLVGLRHSTTTDQIKAAFKRASSPATFICVFRNTSNTNLNGCKLHRLRSHKNDWGAFDIGPSPLPFDFCLLSNLAGYAAMEPMGGRGDWMGLMVIVTGSAFLTPMKKQHLLFQTESTSDHDDD
ncbi:hypothetical protein niasHT_005528 [Heterodera trifolii]|uniref:Uncharacterized protein n=1 Tax=Heterodera trifolii TaxID=157864 RepID=A0ABD2LSV4_9BILA